MFIFEVLGEIFKFKFTKIVLAFLIGSVVGATGMHDLLAGMINALLHVLGISNAHAPSIKF